MDYSSSLLSPHTSSSSSDSEDSSSFSNRMKHVVLHELDEEEEDVLFKETIIDKEDSRLCNKKKSFFELQEELVAILQRSDEYSSTPTRKKNVHWEVPITPPKPDAATVVFGTSILTPPPAAAIQSTAEETTTHSSPTRKKSPVEELKTRLRHYTSVRKQRIQKTSYDVLSNEEGEDIIKETTRLQATIAQHEETIRQLRQLQRNHVDREHTIQQQMKELYNQAEQCQSLQQKYFDLQQSWKRSQQEAEETQKRHQNQIEQLLKRNQQLEEDNNNLRHEDDTSAQWHHRAADPDFEELWSYYTVLRQNYEDALEIIHFLEQELHVEKTRITTPHHKEEENVSLKQQYQEALQVISTLERELEAEKKKKKQQHSSNNYDSTTTTAAAASTDSSPEDRPATYSNNIRRTTEQPIVSNNAAASKSLSGLPLLVEIVNLINAMVTIQQPSDDDDDETTSNELKRALQEALDRLHNEQSTKEAADSSTDYYLCEEISSSDGIQNIAENNRNSKEQRSSFSPTFSSSTSTTGDDRIVCQLEDAFFAEAATSTTSPLMMSSSSVATQTPPLDGEMRLLSWKCSILESERDTIVNEALDLVHATQREAKASAEAQMAVLRFTYTQKLASCESRAQQLRKELEAKCHLKLLRILQTKNSAYIKLKLFLTWRLRVEQSRAKRTKETKTLTSYNKDIFNAYN